ncbi:hypothetical protein Brsp02_02958 [Brucella sp. NBRC 113783]
MRTSDRGFLPICRTIENPFVNRQLRGSLIYVAKPCQRGILLLALAATAFWMMLIVNLLAFFVQTLAVVV